MWVLCLHVQLYARRGHQISLEMAMSHHLVLGIELWTSGIAVGTSNCRPISPVPDVLSYTNFFVKIRFFLLFSCILVYLLFFYERMPDITKDLFCIFFRGSFNSVVWFFLCDTIYLIDLYMLKHPFIPIIKSFWVLIWPLRCDVEICLPVLGKVFQKSS